jgi:hypothetical protein
MDGEQKSRFTLGGKLNVGVQLNAELSFGKLFAVAGGAGFGF